MKKILEFPEMRQTFNYDCGAKALHSIFAYYGIDIREDGIIQRSGTDMDNGTSVSGLLKEIENEGLQYEIKEGMSVEDIKSYIDKKIPVIILVQAWADTPPTNWENDWDDGHYVVAIGYDENNIYFEDPSAIMRTFLPYEELIRRWHDVDTSAESKKYIHLGIAVLGKEPVFSLEKAFHMD